MANVIDFNAALTEKELAAYLASDDFDPQRKDKVLAGLNSSVESFVAWLFPAAIITPRRAQVGNVHGSPGSSLIIETHGAKRGVWSDFADPSQKGGNLIDLFMAARGVSFKDALDQLADWVGHGTRPEVSYQREQQARRLKRVDRDLGPQKGEWHYTDANGDIIATVYRYEPEPGQKEFLPWDAIKRRYGNPDVRPLYNLPGVLQSHSVVVCEGEKAASALIKQGIAATAVMGGCNSPLERSDLTPLRGKDITIWPDADESGRKFAASFALAVQDIAASVRIIEPPADVEQGWDAADCDDVAAVLGMIQTDGTTQFDAASVALGFSLSDWSMDRYSGQAPDIEWLCKGTIPLGVPALFAAMGGIGKSFIALDAALEIASDVTSGSERRLFGGKVMAHGTVVVLTAEDSAASVHRRLSKIDNSNRRAQAMGKAIVVPLPDAGGPMPFIVGDKSAGFKKTPQFEGLLAQLERINDLKLVIIDPLQAFVTADVTSDPAAGYFMWAALAQICARTGASVIVCHHMRKDGMNKIDSADTAREAIRGSAALVDGARVTYALWNTKETEAKAICHHIGVPHRPKRVVSGAVVKANDEHDWEVHTYVRADSGLLEDRTLQAAETVSGEGSLSIQHQTVLLDEIHRRWMEEQPFSASPVAQERYIVGYVQRQFGMEKNAAKDFINHWFDDGILSVETYDKKRKLNGICVMELPDFGRRE